MSARGSIYLYHGRSCQNPTSIPFHESLSRGVVQDHPLGFAIELPAHGFGSFVDETLQFVRRTIDPVRSLSWRKCHRLHADRLLELVQVKSGFGSDGVVNDRGDFID